MGAAKACFELIGSGKDANEWSHTLDQLNCLLAWLTTATIPAMPSLKTFSRFVVAAISLAALMLQAAQPLSSEQQAWIAKGKRFERHGWIYLHIEGGPHARGFQHGYLLANEIADGLRNTRVGWEHQSGMTRTWLVERTTKMFVPKIDVENLAELEGIAEGARAAGVKVSPDEIITYNGIIELSGYWWPTELKKIKDGPTPPVKESCSSFIATGSWTKDGNVVLGHNTMSGYADVFPNVIADIVPERGHRIFWQTCAG